MRFLYWSRLNKVKNDNRLRITHIELNNRLYTYGDKNGSS